jgi:hypothetical protein
VYAASQSVTLTCTDPKGPGCGDIYYTMDGSTPTTSSAIYSSSIAISATTTLKFFARDLSTPPINETVKTQTYTIDTAPPAGSIVIQWEAESTTSPNVTLTLTCSDNVDCTQMKVRQSDVDYVFYNGKRKKIDARNLLRAFYSASEKAKIDNLRFHDLRHAFATRLVQGGIDIYTVQKLGGWKTIPMVMRYAHHYPESLRSGVEVLDKPGKKLSQI